MALLELVVGTKLASLQWTSSLWLSSSVATTGHCFIPKKALLCLFGQLGNHGQLVCAVPELEMDELSFPSSLTSLSMDAKFSPKSYWGEVGANSTDSPAMWEMPLGCTDASEGRIQSGSGQAAWEHPPFSQRLAVSVYPLLHLLSILHAAKSTCSRLGPCLP